MSGEHGAIQSGRMEAGGPVIEAIIGLAALAFAIVGLAHVFPWLSASIATIALGAAFVFEAGAASKRFSAPAGEDRTVKPETRSAWGGLTVGSLSGCAGIALGISALLGFAPAVLAPVAAIVYGTVLVRVSPGEMESEQSGSQEMSREVARERASALSGIRMSAGLSAIMLGILAIMKIAPQTLSLAALLTVGATMLIVSSLVGRTLNFR